MLFRLKWHRHLSSPTPSSYKRKIFKRNRRTVASEGTTGQRISGGDILSFDLCSVVKGHKYEYTHKSERGRSLIHRRPLTTSDIQKISVAANSLKTNRSIVPYVSERSLRKVSLSERLLFYKMRKDSRFLDTVRIRCTGGTGGNGKISYGPPGRSGYGRPNGGNGGSGGNVYLKTDASVTSFHRIFRHHRADNGKNGGGDMCSGQSGKDVIIRVPVGTLISLLKFADVNRNISEAGKESEDHMHSAALNSSDIDSIVKNGLPALSKIQKRKALEAEAKTLSLLAQIDMERSDMLVRIASGGRGGLGNKDYGKFPPNLAEEGYLGSSVFLQLDLKIIADVGLVGLPNAGKSSILATLSNARPKISSVPFTTLHPNLGVLEPESDNYNNFPLKIADIPGLVEGAHLNIGLGHAFLKHIYRSKVIAYVVDISAKDPFSDFEILRNELEAYDSTLVSRPSIIIANKMDLKVSASINLPIFKEKISSHQDPSIRAIQIIPYSSKNALIGENKEASKHGMLQVMNMILRQPKAQIEPSQTNGLTIT